MAKVAFIQRSWFDIHGPMCISAVLKKHGHNCEVFIVLAEKNLISKLKQYNPDIIAFSLVTDEYSWAISLATRIKQGLNIPVIFGGIHPTFCPEECINEPCVDIVCRGEGEYAMLELLDSMAEGRKMSHTIENLWFKQGAEIIRNPVRPLIEDLDALPFPDRSLYYSKYKTMGNYPIKSFLSGRDCPYDCSYCCNRGLKLLYKGKGRMLRKRSPDNLIDEIKEIKAKWAARMIGFLDDEFTYEQKWLESFLDKYKAEIGLPFSCLVRIDLLNEEKVKLLKKSGCITLHFGIETGNERIRREILHRNISNERIIENARLLKKHNLRFNTYNMMNIPSETIENGFETVRLNTTVKTDYPWCSLLQPYPGTEIAEKIFEGAKGASGGYRMHSFYESSPIEQPDSKQLKNLQKFFFIAVKFPWTLWAIKRLISFAPNAVYNFVFLVTFGYRHLKANKLSLLEEFRFNLRHVRGYFKKSIED